jgi:tetratricopeptide (TPR) repeat protein
MAERSGSNPFIFRAPIVNRRLLAGRAQELQEVDEFLSGAAVGRPNHFSLFGEQSIGKSSMLNAVLEVASDRNLLPVKVELRPSIVETELAFYAAVFEAALGSLIEAGILDRDGPLMHAWTRQTLAGDLDVCSDDQPLGIGLLMAAKANGKMIGPIPAPVLQRDLAHLLELGAEFDLRGVVLCLDGAEQLDDNDDLAPSLMDLADADRSLTLVTAAGTSGSLQAAAPRAWGQIEVAPFTTNSQVFEAITLPLKGFEQPELLPSPTTAEDIRTLTGGNPYEINLVCHFIWEAIHVGEQSEFALSDAVIGRVLTELKEKGRHEASPTLSSISGLGRDDYELLARVAPYEALTTRQVALVRLAMDDYDEEQLRQAEREVGGELTRLEDLGIVHCEADRFAVVGGPDERMYLKYAVKRSTGKEMEYDRSYPETLILRCAELLGEHVAGEDYERSQVLSAGQPFELGSQAAGRWLEGVVGGAREGKLEIAASLVADVTSPEAERIAEHGVVVIGLMLQMGIHKVEHVEVIVNDQGVGQSDLEASIQEWQAETVELLGKYDMRVDAFYCAVLEQGFASAATTYGRLTRVKELTYALYSAGFTEPATGLLEESVNEVRSRIDSAPTDPLLRGRLSESVNCLGFMKTTGGDVAVGQELFEESQALDLEEQWLVEFNLTFCKASAGRMEEALAHARLAIELFDGIHGLVVFHAAMPTPSSWQPPGERWNVVWIKGQWVKPFMELQVAVLEAWADPDSRDRLAAYLEGISPSAPSAFPRLAAWSELVLLGRRERALEFLDRALAASDLAGIDVIKAEVEFMKSHELAGALDGARF